MSTNNNKNKIDYSYAANSNLVLRQERKPVTSNEPSGEPETLWGKINPKEMGSLARRETPAEEMKAGKEKGKNKVKSTEKSSTYKPITEETSNTYSIILHVIGTLLGDVEQDIIYAATDEIISFLQSIGPCADSKSFVESIVGSSIDSDKFDTLVNLCNKLNDYRKLKDSSDKNRNEDDGVAVLFEDEEVEDENNEFEINSEDDNHKNDEEVLEQDADEQIIKTAKQEDSEPETSLNIREIDGFWLQRLISSHFKSEHDAQEILKLSNQIYELLGETLADFRDCENQLLELLNYDKFDLIKLLTKHREIIYFCTLLAKAEDRNEAEKLMIKNGYSSILQQIKAGIQTNEAIVEEISNHDQQEDEEMEDVEPEIIDFESLKFKEGSHVMSNKKCVLPEGSYKESKEGYDEITIPAPKPAQISGKNVFISDLPSWARPAFKNTEQLNKVQSSVFPKAFETDENILICAPTGAGKTNCAMLTILRELGKHVLSVNDDFSGAEIDLSVFKIVYIAPMKALVQEMVGNFSSRLTESYGIQVKELSGDSQLSRKELNETQIIVTTPEKFDIITRKGTDREYIQLIRVVIIDEIHLLHDERGPVLESIVARLLRQSEDSLQNIRLVGLSATLPNYYDVGLFMRANKENIFYFDPSYRPCPLRQRYIGISSSSGISKRANMMNRICYEKCLVECTNDQQVLIFVHSRKETSKTANHLKQFSIEEETLAQFVSKNSSSYEILQAEAVEGRVDSKDLMDLLPFGIGIHHAGMSRNDRSLVEDLFAEGHLKVLVSTATLAWGVNLPAHCVIIKGTQIYSPDKGSWVELSIQDVLQMLGRAGRPQYDTFGEGVIITTQKELQFYLSLVNTQLPIESQMISKLADMLNGEIVLNTVRSLDDGVEWLGYTYLYVRMLRNPELYGIEPNFIEDDKYLIYKRKSLIHTALLLLEKSHLIKYDRRTKLIQPTEMGRISSHYYVNHRSMFIYLQQLKPWFNMIDILRVFSQSEEFRLIPIRQEEKLELSKILERVPIPIKDSETEVSNLAKVNVLMQAYISQLKLEGFALLSDMVYIQQSASRIVRAMFEIALKRDWAELARRLLEFSQMIEHRQWSSMSILRQLKGSSQDKYTVPLELIKKIEKTNIPYERLFDLSESELGELVRNQKAGKLLMNALHSLPKVESEVRVMPITRTMIKLEISVNCLYDISSNTDGFIFWLFVEDGSGELLLDKSQIILRPRRKQAYSESFITVPDISSINNIFVSLVPDRFLGLESKLAISFKQMILPAKFFPPTEILDLAPMTLRELVGNLFSSRKLYLKYKPVGDVFDLPLNPILTNCTKYIIQNNNQENSLICANSNDLIVLAELSIIQSFENSTDLIIYCTNYEDKKKFVYERFRNVFESNKTCVVKMSDIENPLHVSIPEDCNIFVTSFNFLELLSKKFDKITSRGNLKLLICDDLDMINTNHKIELSLCRIIPEKKTKILGLSKSITTTKEMAEFLQVPVPSNCFSYAPNVRDLPLEIHLNGINNNSYYTSDYIDLVTYQLIQSGNFKKLFKDILKSPSGTLIAFLPSKKQIKLILNDLVRLYDQSKPIKIDNQKTYDVNNPVLLNLMRLTDGEVSFVYESMEEDLIKKVNSLFYEGKIRILFATRQVIHKLYHNHSKLFSSTVAVLGTRYYETIVEQRNKHYSVNEMYEMISFSNPSLMYCNDNHDAARLFIFSSNLNYYKKFLFEGIPVESCLDVYLNDYFLNEICLLRTVENRQEAVESLLRTFYYKRLSKNPNYYNLYLPVGVSSFSFQYVNEKLSEMVESSFEDMVNVQLIKREADDEDSSETNEMYSALNFGLIGAFYGLDFLTIDIFSISLNKHSKLKGCLEVLSYSNEYVKSLPVREEDYENFVENYSKIVPLVPSSSIEDFNAGFKAFIMFQLYFTRTTMSSDLMWDVSNVLLPKSLTLLYAMIDVLSSNSFLAPSLQCMELCQMMVQGQWDKDSPLLQLPYISGERLHRCNSLGIETVFDFIEYVNEVEEKGEDNEIFKGMSLDQISEIAAVCNNYPSMDTKFELVKVDYEGSKEENDMEEMKISYELNVVLSKDYDEEGPEEWNNFRYYSDKKKQTSWWLVVGLEKTKELLTIKRFSFSGSNTSVTDSGEEQKFAYETRLGFELSYEVVDAIKEGNEGLKLYIMSDSWIGSDQEYEIDVS